MLILGFLLDIFATVMFINHDKVGVDYYAVLV